MKPEEERKTKQKSIRLTADVHSYVQRMEGKNFNQKLNNMILFCMRREKTLYEQEQKLEAQIEKLNEELSLKLKIIENLTELALLINRIKK